MYVRPGLAAPSVSRTYGCRVASGIPRIELRPERLHVGYYGPNLLASEVYERNSRAATALKRSSTVPVHTLGRPNVPRGSPDPQTTHRLLKVPPGAPPGHPQKGRMRRSRARAALSGSAAQGAAHQRVHLEEKASRAPKIISGLPGLRAHGTYLPVTIGRHWRSARFSISRMSVRKCKGAQGASQGAAGVSGPLGMIPRWPRRPVSLCARAGKELGSGKGGRGLRSQSRRWADHRLVVAQGAAQLAVPLFNRSKGAFSPY